MPILANTRPAKALAGIRNLGGTVALSRKYTVTFCCASPACATVPAIHAIIAIRVIVIVPLPLCSPWRRRREAKTGTGSIFFLRNRGWRTIIRAAELSWLTPKHLKIRNFYEPGGSEEDKAELQSTQ